LYKGDAADAALLYKKM